jgi:hypothetical protein
MTVYEEKLNEVLSIYEKLSDLFKSERHVHIMV